MVEQQNKHLDNIFHALADSTRREMVRRLADREHTVTDLAAPFQMSLAAASKHIKVLEEAGLLHRTVNGRKHTCRLNSASLAAAHEWTRYYEHFWTTHLDALELELNKSETGNGQGGKKR